MQITPDDTGQIIRVFNPTTQKPRREKHGVIVCPAKRLFLFINTVKGKGYWGPNLSPKDYKFLQGKTRFISCNYVFYYSDAFGGRNELYDKHGSLKPADLKSLLEAIQTNSKLPAWQLNLIVKNIKDKLS